MERLLDEHFVKLADSSNVLANDFRNKNGFLQSHFVRYTEYSRYFFLYILVVLLILSAAPKFLLGLIILFIKMKEIRFICNIFQTTK